MAVYRRQMLIAQWRPRILVLLFAVALYPLAASPWATSRPHDYLFPGLVFDLRLPRVFDGQPAVALVRPDLAAVETDDATLPLDDQSAAPFSPVLGLSGAPLRGAGGATLKNIGIAISFVDGTIIEPGGRFSFDDVARTWDFHEDPSYLPGPATSVRGIIMMRGGGVCWLSTAIWRAALGAGLKTEYRENHVGLVDALGAGLDATNTLVLRNDSDVPVTIHAWIERDQVYAALDSDEPLGRTAVVRAPQRLGPGRYVAYQEIYWDDGSVTTNEFDSRYAW
jgi:hypothetical protein